MADLQDGESVEMQGSGSRPYVLKNVGGVYSCNCPAWRNQSAAIESRTCKHLRKLRGDQAEQARIGGALPAQPAQSGDDVKAPALLLAESWDGASDPAGWWMSEKLDGVRAYWTGSEFLSRLGNRLHAPDWFGAGLPRVALDGEFWIDRKCFQRTVSIVRRQDQTDLWKDVRFRIFDCPDAGTPFEARLRAIDAIIRRNQPPFAEAVEQSRCTDADHLRRELARIEALGGEGLMLRQPGSLYRAGRNATLLKVKSFRDAEAVVTGHEPGKGRHKGRLGALLVALPDGTQFAVGAGLSDAERSNPPVVGSTITFRYQELTDGGVPRFPSYVGLRAGPAVGQSPRPLSPTTKGASEMSADYPNQRRFEFIGGGSDKFWEIEVQRTTVQVRFGRNGTRGQSNVKSFPDPIAAHAHAEKLIAAKLGKGYVETT